MCILTLLIAVEGAQSHKMRTILTMLGMIIGVGAVITMVALGRGAQSTIEEQVKSAGTNLINVNSGNFQQGGVRQGAGMATSLTAEDATALRQVPGVQYVAAGVNSRGQVIAGNQNWSTQVQGTDVDLPRFAAGSQGSDCYHFPDVNTPPRRRPRQRLCRTQVGLTSLRRPDHAIRNQPFKVIGADRKARGPSARTRDDHLHAVHDVQKKLRAFSTSQHTGSRRPRHRHGGPAIARASCPPQAAAREVDDFMVRNRKNRSVRDQTTRTMTRAAAALPGCRAGGGDRHLKIMLVRCPSAPRDRLALASGGVFGRPPAFRVEAIRITASAPAGHWAGLRPFRGLGSSSGATSIPPTRYAWLWLCGGDRRISLVFIRTQSAGLDD